MTMGPVERSTLYNSSQEYSHINKGSEKSGLDIYMDQIRKSKDVELLSASEEIETIQRMEVGLLATAYLNGVVEQPEHTYDNNDLKKLSYDGDKAKLELINANLRLVISIAKIFSWSDTMLQDLIQEGNVGLLKAVKHFDYAEGFKFSTYAYKCIRNQILRYINEFPSEHLIRMPDRRREELHRVRSARLEFMNKTGKEPLPNDLYDQVKLTVKEVEDYLWLCHEMPSLDWEAADGDNTDYRMSDWITDIDTINPTEAEAISRLNAEDIKKRIDEVIDESVNNRTYRREERIDREAIKEQKRTIIRARYGLGRSALMVGEVSRAIERSRKITSEILNETIRELAKDDLLRELSKA